MSHPENNSARDTDTYSLVAGIVPQRVNVMFPAGRNYGVVQSQGAVGVQLS